VDISLRPLTRGDIPGWADLLARIEKVDGTGEHYGAADLEEEMANPEAATIPTSRRGPRSPGSSSSPGHAAFAPNCPPWWSWTAPILP